MHRRNLFAIVLVALAAPLVGQADVRLPALFTDHMVLQRDVTNKVWGWAEAGETVRVAVAARKAETKAGKDGSWSVTLDPLPAGGPHTLTVKGANEIAVRDVLVGEVWVCSGQSNMQMSVAAAKDADVEILAARYPRLRLISVPRLGTQEPQSDFKGAWALCDPNTVGPFSAVGYYFGRTIHKALDIPVGLIHSSWGGSSCEAWVRRDLLRADERYTDLLQRWEETEKRFDPAAVKANYEKALAQWKDRAAAARKAGKPQPRRPRPPRNPLIGQHRPGNLYCGMIQPLLGYGIRGAIWYQGESNAGRAYQYRHLFPRMISNWREDWGVGDFSFYWVQLADFLAESDDPNLPCPWAELREAQTMTLDALPKTGEAVIIDVGDGKDIHPKNKQDVGVRLARLALAKDYGKAIAAESPRYESMEVRGSKAIVTLKNCSGPLRPFDVREVRGFAIAGEDKKFVAAQAKIVGANKVEVWSDAVAKPVAVRYAWANNPVCNLYDSKGLPVTPFRTDDWPGATIHNTK